MTQIFSIECTDHDIVFHLDSELHSIVKLDIYTPNIFEAECLATVEIDCKGNSFSVSRYYCGQDIDGLYLKYDHHLNGINFVSDVNLSTTKNYPVYSTQYSKKGLRCVDLSDALTLNIQHTVIDLPIQDLIRTYSEDNTKTYRYQGKNFHINFQTTEHLDKLISFYTSHKIHTTINLLVCTPVDERMRKIVQHPNYEPKGRMSAINVIYPESCEYLEAACDYLAKRYTQPKLMQIDGIILANEINVQGIWSNAGECSCEDYMKEYTRALRLAWQAGVKYWKNWRVYISLESHWGSPLEQYSAIFKRSEMYEGKNCLYYLDILARNEGNFNWNIAYHPYASNLMLPDFYNDDKAIFDENSFVLSFKNLQVLIDYIHYNLSTWNNSVRKVILSEQGFNSADDLGLEYVQAAAFGRAFKEVMNYPEIEAFIYHSHADNEHEEGLKLGLRRTYDFSSEINKKPIYNLFKMIENKTYDGKYLWEHF